MKERLKHCLSVLSLLVLILAIPACGRRVSPAELPGRQDIAPTSQRDMEVNGSLEEVNGVRVLRVWGSRQEMGYAQGYLLADDLMELFEEVLFDTFPRQWTYERVIGMLKEYVVWPEGYRDEMEGIVRGIEAALGGLPEVAHQRIEAGSVVVNADMVAILNAHTDLVDLPRDCCSFAAWGAATDGQTRVGGNQQGQRGPLHDYALLMVRQPEDGLSTACSNIPGSLTCMRGLNETGVAMMPQGAETPWIEIDGPCYAGVHGRLILERVAAGPDMVSQIVEVFEAHPRCGSSIFLFAQGIPAWSDPNADQRAVVIEHDYEGVAARLPSHNALHGNPLTEAIVTTNHFLQRETPAPHPTLDESDRRYQAMVAVIQEDVSDLADMQEVLIACDRGGIAQQTVYVEPDVMTIHVAFRPNADAPRSAAQAPVSFTWEELFTPR